MLHETIHLSRFPRIYNKQPTHKPNIKDTKRPPTPNQPSNNQRKTKKHTTSPDQGTIPSLLNNIFTLATPLSTSHISTPPLSHPITTPRPSQSQLTHVGTTFWSPGYVNEARRGDRLWIRVSQILMVASAEQDARRGCEVGGVESSLCGLRGR